MTKQHTLKINNEIIKKTIFSLLESNSITMDKLLGIGIGSVGPLDRRNGVILNTKYFLAPGWVDIPIVKQFNDIFPGKFILENGANTAALGEYYHSNIP